MIPETYKEKSQGQAVMGELAMGSYCLCSVPCLLSSPFSPAGCRLLPPQPGNVPFGHNTAAGISHKRGQCLSVAFLLFPSIRLPLFVLNAPLGNPSTQPYLWLG